MEQVHQKSFHCSFFKPFNLYLYCIIGAFQNHFQTRRRNSLAVNHLLMGKQPLTRKKSHQPQFVFAEKGSNSKSDQRLSFEGNSKQLKHSGSEEEKDETKALCPSTSHNDSNAFDFRDSNGSSSSNRYCDSKSIGIKPRSASLATLSLTDAEASCSCSSSFACPSHVDSAVDKPATVNPFPTKRRVGSMKTKLLQS